MDRKHFNDYDLLRVFIAFPSRFAAILGHAARRGCGHGCTGRRKKGGGKHCRSQFILHNQYHFTVFQAGHSAATERPHVSAACFPCAPGGRVAGGCAEKSFPPRVPSCAAGRAAALPEGLTAHHS